ncbi:MAG TPA: DivIVA domain-containing protein [Acidimicrobiales bacterium]|jgi:cell division initiation protein
MELTPQALHDVEFREARRGGYNTRDVDDFLERVAVGIAQLQDRLREAYHRAEAAESRLGDMQRQLDDVQRRGPEGPSDADETLRRTLVLAQRTADATIKEAKDEASRMLSEAHEEASRTRASAESDALRDARVEMDQLSSSRDALLADIEAIEQHLDDQRTRLRGGISELQQLLESSALKPTPVPDPAEVSLPSRVVEEPVVEAPSSGPTSFLSEATHLNMPPAPNGDAVPGEPAFAESPFADLSRGALDESTRRGDGSMVAALQELPRREPLEPREPRESREPVDPAPATEPMGFPPATPAAATGFLPDLRSTFESPEPPPPPANDPVLDDLPLPIDAPPPPPPPPGLEHLHEVGGIPIEPGSRPSEWGRGVFDTEDDHSEGTRFGRRR